MATKAKINCKNCGNTFEVFWIGFSEEQSIECPYCDRKLDKKFNKYLKNALGCTWELNKELRSSHQDYETDLFEISIEEVYVSNEKFKPYEEK